MKKTYVNPEIEILEFAATECFNPPINPPKEILSSTGEVVGYEETKEEKKCVKSSKHSSHGWWFWCWWPW